MSESELQDLREQSLGEKCSLRAGSTLSEGPGIPAECTIPDRPFLFLASDDAGYTSKTQHSTSYHSV